LSEHTPISAMASGTDEIGEYSEMCVVDDLLAMCEPGSEEYRSGQEAILKLVCTDPVKFAAARAEMEAEWRGDPKPPIPPVAFR
jgi:hypothetical protein